MLRKYKEYMVVVRPASDGKWILRQTEEGLEIKNDEMYCKPPGWSFWSEYEDFRRTWMREGLNPNHSEYEEDLVVESFETFEDAYEFMLSAEGDDPLYTDIK